MAFKKTSDTTRNDGTTKKPDPQIWLNIGYNSIDEETGETTFVSLPLGLGIDTMEGRKLTPRMSTEFKQLLNAKNELLDSLQRYTADFAAGQEEIITDLQIQIRRVEEATPSAEDDENNPHLNNLSRLSFASPKAA